MPVSLSYTVEMGRIQGSGQIQIIGLPMAALRELTYMSSLQNGASEMTQVVISAELGGALLPVYLGAMIEGTADFNAAPDVAFNVRCTIGGPKRAEAAPVTTLSARDGVLIADVIRRLMAESLPGYVVVNRGVTASCAGYYRGSGISQAERICADAGIHLAVDPKGRRIIISPEGMNAPGARMHFLSASSGMIGYPVLSSDSLTVRKYFDPTCVCGDLLRVKTDVPGAQQQWVITGVTHRLSTGFAGGGLWETQLKGVFNASWDGVSS